MDLLAPPPAATPTPTPEPAPAAPVTPAAEPQPAATPAVTPEPPAATTQPAFSTALPENWTASLPDEMQQYADSLKRFSSVEDLAKSMLHFRQVGPTYPTADSTPDDIARFRAMANVPAKPEDYGITKPENYPADLEWDDNTAQLLAKIAHEHHVPAPALKALAQAQEAANNARLAQFHEAEAAETKANIAMVQQHLGTGDDYARNTANIRHIVGRLSEELGLAPDNPHLAAIGKNPAAVLILHKVAQLTSEDQIKRPSSFSDMRSNQQRAEAIMNYTDPVWGEKYKNGDMQAVRYVEGLLKNAD